MNKKVVVFYNWIGSINGALIDAFEYFIAILESEPVYFLIMNCYPLQLMKFIEVFENRYDLDDLNWKEHIILMENTSSLIKHNFEAALVVDYSTIFKTKGLLRADKIIVLSDLHTDKKDFMYDKSRQNVIYYGEMPFVYKDHEYKHKFLFNRFKRLGEAKSGIYFNAPYSGFKKVKCPIQETKPIVYKSEIHQKNLFEQFDTYFYYHTDWFDPHPRLFHECWYYEKEIIYYNPDKIKDGSWYRYKEVERSDWRELHGRFFSEDDEVIKEFL